MSPRHKPQQRYWSTPPAEGPPAALPPDVQAVHNAIENEAAARHARTSTSEPYVRGGPFSFFGDLFRLGAEGQRKSEAVASPILRGADPGEPASLLTRNDELQAVKGRLSRYRVAQTLSTWPEARDLGTASGSEFLRPSAPDWLGEAFAEASRQTGTLVEALDVRPLEAGMVDTSSGLPVLDGFPRLLTGAATAVQASQNSGVQETDPTTGAGQSSGIATIAGQVDMSQQLVDFSRPGMDDVIASDLGRDFGSKADLQIVNGSGASGQTRGLLSWTGILSVTGAVTSAQALISKVWNAFDSLAGTSGYGSPDVANYVTIMHPRRWAMLHSGSGAATVPVEPVLPGTVILSAGIPTNLGAGTNEDVILVVERSNVVLVGRSPTFRVFPEVGSGTLTVRSQAYGYISVMVKNPAAIAKITGLTPPTY